MAIDVMDNKQKPSLLQPLDALIAERATAHEPAWLQTLRDRARAQLQTSGLPSRRRESWHYSPADVWLQQTHTKSGLAPIAADVATAPDFASANSLQFSHGHLVGHAFADDVTLLPLTRLDAEKHAAIIDWLRTQPRSDSLGALATALAPQSQVLIVPAGANLRHPIVVSHHTTRPGAQIAHLIVWVEAGASATVFENFSGANGIPSLQIACTQVCVNRNAKLVCARLNREGTEAQHLGVFEGDVQRDARLHVQVLHGGENASGANQKLRNGVYIRLQESGAEFVARGAFAARGAQHIDYHFTVEHNADHGRCDIEVQGIAGDRSNGIVNGRIFIARNTRANDGHFTSHNLLLSQEAEIDAKPELEIYADEVRCDHGATVGQLDDSQLLYLQTRGIDRNEAIALLTEGFLKAGLLGGIDTAMGEYLQAQLLASIQSQTDGGGDR
jgi:Fe-S cluster assembly protein SufD